MRSVLCLVRLCYFLNCSSCLLCWCNKEVATKLASKQAFLCLQGQALAMHEEHKTCMKSKTCMESKAALAMHKDAMHSLPCLPLINLCTAGMVAHK